MRPHEPFIGNPRRPSTGVDTPKSYVLFGIDKYRHSRLLCIVSAASIQDAARKLCCTVADVGRSGERAYSLYFEARQECGRLVIDDRDAFHMTLAKGRNSDAPQEVLEKIADGYAYGTDHVYREYLIGTAPVFP